MQYRELGHTGIKVSTLGFGCMRLPFNGTPDNIDEPAATKLLHNAIDNGVNYVDTAWFYHAKVFGQKGESEPLVGRALSGGWRKKVFLATKLPQMAIHAKEDMEIRLQEQLKRLQTDYIDFYLVHGLDGENWDRMCGLGVCEFMDSAVKRGLVRFTGFSFHGHKDDFPRIVDGYSGFSFAQVQYNYMDTEFQAGYSGLRYAADKGLGVVVMEPLKGGKLAQNLPAEMQAVFDKRKEGWSPAEWALRYVLNEPRVSVLLSGMNAQQQLDENLRVCSVAEPDSLSKEELSVYDAAIGVMRASIKADCTACRYCQPCEQGVEIPEILSALNASAMWKTKDQWLTGYMRIKGKPNLCIECAKCEEICPQKLPIMQLLKDTAAVFGG